MLLRFLSLALLIKMVCNTVKIVNFLGKVLKTLSLSLFLSLSLPFFTFYNKIGKRKKNRIDTSLELINIILINII